MSFPLWYGGTEQVLRYHAVKMNAFAREPALPGALASGGDAWTVWLAESVLLGAPDDPPKSLARMISTEGVVSAFFVDLAGNEALCSSMRDDAFYARFGKPRSDVTPLENVYLKTFHVLHERRPSDVLGFVEGWLELFPDETRTMNALAAAIFLDQKRVLPPEIWLANPDFAAGTSLFDQFRALPRIHTFDLNASSTADLLGVPEVDRERARSILLALPVGSLDELAALPAVDTALAERFRGMARAMDALRKNDPEQELSFAPLIRSYLVRAAAWLLVTSALGAVIVRALRSLAWWRAIVNGATAAFLALLVGWFPTSLPMLAPLLVVLVLVGLPAALLHRRRHPGRGGAIRVLVAWLLAATPAFLAAAAIPWNT